MKRRFKNHLSRFVFMNQFRINNKLLCPICKLCLVKYIDNDCSTIYDRTFGNGYICENSCIDIDFKDNILNYVDFRFGDSNRRFSIRQTNESILQNMFYVYDAYNFYSLKESCFQSSDKIKIRDLIYKFETYNLLG